MSGCLGPSYLEPASKDLPARRARLWAQQLPGEGRSPNARAQGPAWMGDSTAGGGVRERGRKGGWGQGGSRGGQATPLPTTGTGTRAGAERAEVLPPVPQSLSADELQGPEDEEEEGCQRPVSDAALGRRRFGQPPAGRVSPRQRQAVLQFVVRLDAQDGLTMLQRIISRRDMCVLGGCRDWALGARADPASPDAGLASQVRSVGELSLGASRRRLERSLGFGRASLSGLGHKGSTGMASAALGASSWETG